MQSLKAKPSSVKVNILEVLHLLLQWDPSVKINTSKVYLVNC